MQTIKLIKKKDKLMRKQTFHVPLLSLLTVFLLADTSNANEDIDRTTLPIVEPKAPLYNELDVRKVKMPAHFEVKAPDEAPNVLLVLIDDMGFGVTGTFGGPITTPKLDAIANEGLRYNNFHTTALCSPTRVALKSGRNHHVGNMGSISETATGFPGNTGQIPNSVAPVAEMLRLNGYNTAAYGKWHETAAWEGSISGPFDRRPLRQGFDEFYGFIGGETNQWAPSLYHGNTPIELPTNPNYHFLTDMTDKAIAWMKFQKAITPDKPFFVYFAPGAVHAPHHVPKEYIAHWKGKFDQGWDKIREESLARQIKMGTVPKGTILPPKPKDIKDWESLSADEKRLFAHQAEVFAGFVEMTDHEIGRVVKAIDDLGETDNTMIIYIAGDNGTSAEGGQNGMFNEYTYFNQVQEKVPDMLKVMDKWGSSETYPHMAAGWAVAFDSPYTWTKQMASDFGGTKTGMVVKWPKGIKAKGEIRPQFHHVIDIAPTILEAAHLPEPKTVNGTPQVPMQGVDMAYSFNDKNAADRHTTQYFEIFGNRAIYNDGWYARVLHREPWKYVPTNTLENDKWELYDAKNDFSLSTDLSAKYPEKLAELKVLFMSEAKKNNVLPIDDRILNRMVASTAGRPDLMAGRKSMTLSEGMVGMTENTFLNVKNQSSNITAEIEISDAKTQGAIIVQGGRFGGWALYMQKGVPAFDYNFLGLERTTIKGTKPLTKGKHTIRYEFAYDGGGLGKGGVGTLYADNVKIAQKRIQRTQPTTFSIDDQADVGIDLGTPVVEAIGAGEKSKFTGHIPKLTIELK